MTSSRKQSLVCAPWTSRSVDRMYPCAAMLSLLHMFPFVQAVLALYRSSVLPGSPLRRKIACRVHSVCAGAVSASPCPPIPVLARSLGCIVLQQPVADRVAVPAESLPALWTDRGPAPAWELPPVISVSSRADLVPAPLMPRRQQNRTEACGLSKL